MDEIIPLEVCSIKVESEDPEEMPENQFDCMETQLTSEPLLKQEFQDDENEDMGNDELEPPLCVTLPDPGDVLQVGVLEDPLSDITSISDSWIKEECVFYDTEASSQDEESSLSMQTSLRNLRIPNYSNGSCYESPEYEDPFEGVSVAESRQEWIEEAKQKVEKHIQEVRRRRKLKDGKKTVKTEPEDVVIVPSLVFVPRLCDVKDKPEEVKTENPPVPLFEATSPRPRPALMHGYEWDQWVREEKARLERHIIEVRESRKRKFEEGRKPQKPANPLTKVCCPIKTPYLSSSTPIKAPYPSTTTPVKSSPNMSPRKAPYSSKTTSAKVSSSRTRKESPYKQFRILGTVRTLQSVNLMGENSNNLRSTKLATSSHGTDTTNYQTQDIETREVTGSYKRGLGRGRGRGRGRGKGRGRGRVAQNHLKKNSSAEGSSMSVVDFAVRETFSCPDCGMCFHSELDLKEHLLPESAAMGDSFSCVECSCVFSTCCALTQHQMIHVKTEASQDDSLGNLESGNLTLESSKPCFNALNKKLLHRCRKCEKTFLSESLLENHLRDHSNDILAINDNDRQTFMKTEDYPVKTNEQYCRDQCNQQLDFALSSSHLSTSTKLLTPHVKQKAFNRKPVHKCNICEKIFLSESLLLNHSKDHELKQAILYDKQQMVETEISTNDQCKSFLLPKSNACKCFKCDVCGKDFAQKANLIVHIRRHTGEKPFQCNVCKKNFCDPSNLRRHELTHESDMRRITRGKENGVKKCICQLCGFAFRSQSYLKKHEIVHTNATPHKCNECGRAFKYRSSLVFHYQLHTDVRNFKCKMCGKAFLTNSILIKHCLYHCPANKTTQKKKNKCETCGKAFLYFSDLQRHILVHTGERPFECEHCQDKFTVKSNLVKHMITHHSIKCAYCKKIFAVKSNLLKHMSTEHSISSNKRQKYT